MYIHVTINFARVMLDEKKPVKYYVWNIDFYGAKNWTFRKSDQQYWNVLKCGAEKDGEDQFD
jgi:hypothetical protein